MFNNVCYRFVPLMDKYCTARQSTDDHIIWRMRFACWINKASHTNSEYVILTSSPQQQQQCFSESASTLFCMYISGVPSWVGVFNPSPPRNSKVLTKLSRIPSFVENKSVTIFFLGNVIPVVCAKLISRKRTVYNTTKCI